jgi:hypothetical protein
MDILNRMRTAPVVLLIVFGTSDASAQTAAATAVVGCDLLTPPEPSALYLQVGDGLSDPNSGQASGISSGQEVRGLSCAQVLSELLSEGFSFQEFTTIGINDATGIWYWQKLQ